MPKAGEIRKGHEIGRKEAWHKYIWHACIDCGKERWVMFNKGKPRSLLCSKCSGRKYGLLVGKRTGEDASNWQGGRRNDGKGYTLVWVANDDFFSPMRRTNGCIREHRLVMAKHLNRCLLPWEVVHHKNGIKDDNRIQNLELLPDRRWHLVDLQTKAYITLLEGQIRHLEGLLELKEV